MLSDNLLLDFPRFFFQNTSLRSFAKGTDTYLIEANSKAHRKLKTTKNNKQWQWPAEAQELSESKENNGICVMNTFVMFVSLIYFVLVKGLQQRVITLLTRSGINAVS